MKKALILVDIQIDFLPGGALPVGNGQEVIPLANALQPYFDLIVATQDWHPHNHLSFASQHADHKIGDVIDLDGLPQVLWPDHCVQETLGASLAPGLNTESIARIFQKGTDPRIDSYSGFFDNGHRRSTGLGEYLRERKISDVYIVGLATDYCVRATALDAVKLGFQTYLIEDACRGVELKAGDIQRAIAELEAAGVKRVTSDQWLRSSTEQSGQPTEPEVLVRGNFLELVSDCSWEYIRRINSTGVVAIVPITNRREVILVEQFRNPIGVRSIELPAGLVGDTEGGQEEQLENAVRRELMEETGYHAARVEWLGNASTSAGLTSEMVDVFLATGLEQIQEGQGDGDEQIVVHRIPWDDVSIWLSRRARQGYSIALSLLGGLWLAEHSASARLWTRPNAG